MSSIFFLILRLNWISLLAAVMPHLSGLTALVKRAQCECNKQMNNQKKKK